MLTWGLGSEEQGRLGRAWGRDGSGEGWEGKRGVDSRWERSATGLLHQNNTADLSRSLTITLAV